MCNSYYFSFANDLTQMVNFLTHIPDYYSHSPVIFGLFISDVSIRSTVGFPPFGNSHHVVLTVPIDFLSNSKQNSTFHHIAHDYCRADWDGLQDHLRDVPWEAILILRASAAASEFCQSVQVGNNAYITNRKYQIIFYSFPWFPVAYTAGIVHRNHFPLFVPTKQIFRI